MAPARRMVLDFLNVISFAHTTPFPGKAFSLTPQTLISKGPNLAYSLGPVQLPPSSVKYYLSETVIYAGKNSTPGYLLIVSWYK